MPTVPSPSRPDANFNGEERFSYTVSDGNGGFDTAVMRVDVAPVNDAPEGGVDSIDTLEDTPIVIAAADLLANDSDIDGDHLSIHAVQDARNGSVVLNADGTITFTPDANFNGEARFSYTVSDGNGGTDIVPVTVNVGATDDAPTSLRLIGNLVPENTAGAMFGIVQFSDSDGGTNQFNVDDPRLRSSISTVQSDPPDRWHKTEFRA